MARRSFVTGITGASILANVLFLIWGRRTFMPLGIVWVSAALLGILLLVLAAILRAFNKARPDPAARLSIRMSVASAIVCFALLPSVPVLKHFHRVDFNAARARADNVIPLLEAHREASGVYPTSLCAVVSRDALPWLLLETDAYRSTGTGYVLQIRHPGNPLAAHVRRHTDTRWRTTQ
jgi:hypothetical protein